MTYTTLLYRESPVLGIIATVLPFISIYYRYDTVFIMSIIILCGLLYFYRYRPHNNIYDDYTVISPASGLITNIKHIHNYLYISIFLSPLDEHAQIYPANGIITERVYDDTGIYKLVVDGDKSRQNEKKIHFMQMHNGKFISVTQIAGFLPRRIASDEQVPQTVNAGQYLGIIKFGSRVDILLPSAGFKMSNAITINKRIEMGELIGQYVGV